MTTTAVIPIKQLENAKQRLAGLLGPAERSELFKAMVQDDQATIAEILPDRDSENGDIYSTGLKVVVPDGTTSLNRGMFDSNTEFLTLSEFRAWLRENGLSGS